MKATMKLGTFLFCACLLFFASTTQGEIKCYRCEFALDDGESCNCRLNPSKDFNTCKYMQFNQSEGTPIKRPSNNTDDRDGADEVCGMEVYNTIGDKNITLGMWRYRELLKRVANTDPDKPVITSECKIDLSDWDGKSTLYRRCWCNKDWCNGQPIDLPTHSKPPSPSPDTPTPAKSSTPGGLLATTISGNSGTTGPTPAYASSSGIKHGSIFMHKYNIVCRTMILSFGSFLLHSASVYI